MILKIKFTTLVHLSIVSITRCLCRTIRIYWFCYRNLINAKAVCCLLKQWWVMSLNYPKASQGVPPAWVTDDIVTSIEYNIYSGMIELVTPLLSVGLAQSKRDGSDHHNANWVWKVADKDFYCMLVVCRLHTDLFFRSCRCTHSLIRGSCMLD